MLLLLAAASLAAATPADPAPLAKPFLVERRLDVTVRNPSACRTAARMQTSTPAEPALLFRPQGPGAMAARRLIDLPRAEKCLLGGSDGR